MNFIVFFKDGSKKYVVNVSSVSLVNDQNEMLIVYKDKRESLLYMVSDVQKLVNN